MPPVLGQPIQIHGPGGIGPAPLGAPPRSALDPINLDPVPPPLFPNPQLTEDDFLRVAGVYGAVRPEPAIFFNSDTGALIPRLKNNLQSTVVFPNGVVATVNVPTTDLNWGANFKIELGYRLPDTLGAFAMSWRNFNAEGNGDEPYLLGSAPVKTRLTVNLGDFDYLSAPFIFSPRFDAQYRIGARIAGVYFDTAQQNELFAQHESNYMFGGGPHFYLEGSHRFVRVPGLSAFAGLDTAVILGQVTQRFTAKILPNQIDYQAYSQQFKIISVPSVNFQTGLSFTPWGAHYLKFSTGVQLEYWWDLGNIYNSTATLGDLGLFLRGQVDF